MQLKIIIHCRGQSKVRPPTVIANKDGPGGSSPFAVRRSQFAVPSSPFPVRRSPFAVRRSQFAVRRSPFAGWNPGTLEPGTLEPGTQKTEVSGQRSADSRQMSEFRTLELWNPGTLELWNHGTLESRSSWRSHVRKWPMITCSFNRYIRQDRHNDRSETVFTRHQTVGWKGYALSETHN
jgi:hypothetical protein